MPGRQQVNDPWSALRISIRADDADRFIHQKILLFLEFDPFSIHTDLLSLRIDLDPQLCNGFTINCNATVPDVFLTVPSRSDTGRGKHFLQAFEGRIIVGKIAVASIRIGIEGNTRHGSDFTSKTSVFLLRIAYRDSTIQERMVTEVSAAGQFRRDLHRRELHL